MRVFKEMNMEGKEVCPICNKKENKPVVLIGIVGTQKGHNIQAIQVHLECLNLLYNKERGFIYQKISQKEEEIEIAQ